MGRIEFQIIVSSDGHMSFIDREGIMVNPWDVLNFATVAGCYITVKKSYRQQEPVTHLSVLEDARFSPEQAWIVIGNSEEIE